MFSRLFICKYTVRNPLSFVYLLVHCKCVPGHKMRISTFKFTQLKYENSVKQKIMEETKIYIEIDNEMQKI